MRRFMPRRFQAVADKKKLWRYMPLIQLVEFLQSKTLRFARADTFEDVKEGHFGIDVMMKSMANGLPKDKLNLLESGVKRLNSECFVTCWHLSTSESLAMWKIYGANNFSIALVSNVGKVMTTCHDFCEDLSTTGMMGEVVYGNYIKDGQLKAETICIPFGFRQLPIPQSILTLFMKAKPFNFEQEWRLVLHNKKIQDKSISVPVKDLNDFIEAIYVSPEAPDWMVNSIKNLISKQFDLPSVKVSKSPLWEHFGI
jgi:hypothetical protein